MPATTARLTAGMLVVLAACTGSSSASFAVDPRIPPSVSLDDLHDARERHGAARGLSDRSRRSGPHGGLRRGWKRVGARPASDDATCLFPAPAPGPFTWNPRGDRALLSDLEIASIDGRQLRAGSSSVTRGDVVGASDRRGRRLRLSQRHAPAQDLPRHAAARRHHADTWRPLPERHLPPVGARDRVRRRHRRTAGDLAVVERGRGSGAARLCGRRHDVRRARLHRRRRHAPVCGRARRRCAAPPRARPPEPDDQPGVVAWGRGGPDLVDRHPAPA